MKRLCFCLCTAFGILLFVLKKPIGISVLGLCAVLFVLSVCVNIFSKKKAVSNTGKRRHRLEK